MRRSNGEGTVVYNKTRKRYEAHFTFTDPITKKIKHKGFTSVKSAKIALKKGKTYMEVSNSGIDHDLGKQNLKTWLDYWVENYKKHATKPKTYERYSGLIEKNLIPFLGKIFLKDLTTIILQKHLNYLLEKGGANNQGLAPRSVNATRRLMISALEDAVELDCLDRNPARRTKPCKIGRTELKVLTLIEGRKLLDTARLATRTISDNGNRNPNKIVDINAARNNRAILVVALGTGLRIGEIFGLEWKNINFDEKYLVVQRTVVTTKEGRLVQETGKTHSSLRKVDLPNSVVFSLKRFWLWQKLLHIRLGSKFKDSSFIFVNMDGKPRSPNTFSCHTFKRILKQAGLSSDIRMHDLRHTHATWLLQADVNVKVVSERLGHSNCRITLDTYAHVMKTMQDRAVDALNNIFVCDVNKDEKNNL